MLISKREPLKVSQETGDLCPHSLLELWTQIKCLVGADSESTASALVHRVFPNNMVMCVSVNVHHLTAQ